MTELASNPINIAIWLVVLCTTIILLVLFQHRKTDAKSHEISHEKIDRNHLALQDIDSKSIQFLVESMKRVEKAINSTIIK